MFDLYPRHGHRSPQQIAEDTGGAFEPIRRQRVAGRSDPSVETASPTASTPMVTDQGSSSEAYEPR